MKKFTYGDKNRREISFPLGGIGTGCIGILGNGAFGNFEIQNHFDKKTSSTSFFAIKAEKGSKLIDARILQSDAETSAMEEFPHFPKCSFLSYFPFSELNFSYEKFPATVKMTAFNPFIPLNDTDSAIPAAFFEFEICNTDSENVNFTLCGVLENLHTHSLNRAGCTENGIAHIYMDSSTPLFRDKNGNMCISTDGKNISFQEYLLRGSWLDRLQMFWNDFTLSPTFNNRSYDDKTMSESCGVLATHFSLNPGETKTVRFLFSWHFPYSTNYYHPIPRKENESDEEYINKNSFKKYYSQYFEDSLECASYCFSHWDRLKSSSLKFSETMLGSTLPHSVLDAVANNLCVLKSPACLRLDDGTFWGWVCSETEHYSYNNVWHDAYALSYLFPKLARSMTENHIKHGMDENGGVASNIFLPKERNQIEARQLYMGSQVRVCADVQLCMIINSYRDFKISGDRDELIEKWYDLCKVLDYCFSKNNPYCWDPDMTGVMQVRQHNALNSELHTPNFRIQGLYLTALKAGCQMARIVGDKKRAETYHELFNKGKKWAEENLRNGESSNIDTILGQWHADLSGLGEIFNTESVKNAIKTHPEECTTGFEYVAAGLMLMHGKPSEGLELVDAIRKRYDGEYCNPFSETEYENDRPRSMASYALLNATSGFKYDSYNHHIAFSPLSDHCPLEFGGTFRCFFCVEAGWGYVEEGIDYIEINIISGKLDIRSFGVPRTPRLVQYGGRNWRFSDKGLCAELDTNLIVTPDKKLTILIDIKPQN